MAEITQDSPLAAPVQPEASAQRPSWVTGAIVGGLLTIPLLAVFWLADQLLGLPFVPFDIFDWLVQREELAEVIRIGITIIIALIDTFDLGQTDQVAKVLENLQALVMFVGIGVVVGPLLFVAWSRLKQHSKALVYTTAAAVGLAIGVIVALISAEIFFETNPDEELTNALWIILAFAVWGLAFGWVYNDLNEINEDAVGGEQALVPMNRRQFIVRLGGATATLTLFSTGLTALVRAADSDDDAVTTASLDTDLETAALPESLPNADASVQAPLGTRPEYTPLDDHYRIDISSRPPEISGDTYRLKIGGLVKEPVEVSLGELRDNYEPVDHFVTLSCISNPIGGDLISTTKWTGVPMHTLLDDWGVTPEATHLHITSADGFDEWVEIDMIRNDDRIMLAYAWDDLPLKQKHGFPLRIWIPDLYGMKQPKWITNIDAVDSWGEGYWVRRRWDAVARVNLVSVVDTISVEDAYERDGQFYVPFAGIAYSGARGISKVEVSINEGEWMEAEMREPLSDTTWVIWRYDWPFEEGDHRVHVRAWDGNGTAQIAARRDRFPSGATGIHSRARDIETADVNPQPESASVTES